MNLYRYVGNNPVNYTDPSGLFGDGTKAGKKYLGHSDFAGYPLYDWTLEDNDWRTNPYFACNRHFRYWIQPIEMEIDDAIRRCAKEEFVRLMHQAQDTFVHTPNYSCSRLGHVWDSISGKDPDNNPQAWQKANSFTKRKLDEFKKRCACSGSN